MITVLGEAPWETVALSKKPESHINFHGSWQSKTNKPGATAQQDVHLFQRVSSMFPGAPIFFSRFVSVRLRARVCVHGNRTKGVPAWTSFLLITGHQLEERDTL